MAIAHEILGNYDHVLYHTTEVLFLVGIVALSFIIYKVRKD